VRVLIPLYPSTPTKPPLLSPKTRPTTNPIRTLTHTPGRPFCCERSGIAVWGVFVKGVGGGVDRLVRRGGRMVGGWGMEVV